MNPVTFSTIDKLRPFIHNVSYRSGEIYDLCENMCVASRTKIKIRRELTFAVASLFIVLYCVFVPVLADEAVFPVHAIAMHGTPKYGPDFKHFDYVNPDVPKGGTLRLAQRGTFDSFHNVIAIGNAIGTGSQETLLTRSVDEVFTEYGLIAESLEVPDNRTWVIFNLRPEARWHDGEPITADDVIWSFEMLTTVGNPFWRDYYKDVERVEKLGELRVKFVFKPTLNRELPLILGQFPIMPQHYWATRDFEKTTLEPPLGSGPYRIKDFEAGRYIVRERVEDYWGEHLPVNQGINNFDEVRITFYRDTTAIRLALKAGDIDLERENQSKAWATEYNISSVKAGWLKKEAFPHQLPAGMQAFAMNTRRDNFKDIRVRKALAYAFDFEWSNKNLFYGQYARTESFFENSELASSGLPEGEELQILNRFRDRLPTEVFEETYRAPKTKGDGRPRQNLRLASRLLKEAGWEVREGKLINVESGEPFNFEFLITNQAFERIVLPFAQNLEKLGIEMKIRLVDQSQYINRLRSFDFDMVVGGWGQSDSPGNEQRNYWSTLAADLPGSRNLAGIKDPVIDELIELLIQSTDRQSLIHHTRALDRVLLAGHYVIPNWHNNSVRMLYWDRFSRPETSVRVGVYTDRWWYDEQKARQLEQKKQAGTN